MSFYFVKPPGQSSRTALFVAAFGTAVCSAGCDNDNKGAKEPTEPWLKEAVEHENDEAATLTGYRVAPGMSLSFALPTRTKKPSGTIRGISGSVDFALGDLAKSRGKIEADLTTLEVNSLPTQSSKKSQTEQDHLTVESPTLEALNWLGLGAGVSSLDRAKNSTAVFRFGSLRELSHPSAATGAPSRNEPARPGIRRQVHATLDGELDLRGFSVQRKVPVTLSFQLSSGAAGESAKAAPDSIDVALRGELRVPLSEYDITPRGPEGHEIAEKSHLLGTFVGTQALVSGTITLVRTRDSR